MTEFAQEPAVVLLAVVLATALLVFEFALPTLGIAGTAAAGLIVLAGVGINEGELEWWPLSLAVIAIVMWCVMIARRQTSVVQQAVAVGIFTVGSLAFSIVAEDVTAIVVSLASAAGLAVGFPYLFERAARLADAPSSVGMDSHVGRTAPGVGLGGHDRQRRARRLVLERRGPRGPGRGRRGRHHRLRRHAVHRAPTGA